MIVLFSWLTKFIKEVDYLHYFFDLNWQYLLKNSLTAKSCYGGEKHRNPVGFYSRNSTENTLHHKHNNHKHHHHGGAVCPSYGVGLGSMDTPDRTRVTSSEGIGRGVGGIDLIKSIK